MGDAKRRCQGADVVIVGNGPSAICLSYFLSGYRPYYNGTPVANPYLNEKLQKLKTSQSIVDMELESLCEGLEGRSSNPVAVLFDALCHPDADLGADNPSVLEWKFEEEHAINHIVLGKLRPGGAWQKMDGSMQTLSLSSWMELPDLPFHDWLKKQKRLEDSIEVCSNRATWTEVCNYYMSYVDEKKIAKNFLDYHTVTSIQKVYRNKKVVDSESGETEPCCSNMKSHPFCWEVRGYEIKGSHDSAEDDDLAREEFCISALNVVLATGTYDIPNKLGVSGEILPHVSHSLHEFESVINNKLTLNSDPVLIVGAGLSAADAVLMALDNEIPVVHVFRRGANDSNLVLKRLPPNMYPEYHKVHSLMKGSTSSPLYRPVAKQEVAEILEDKKVLLTPSKKGCTEISSLEVSHIVILIGARPDLSFLPLGGRDLGVIKKFPIESKHNPIDIDPYTYQSVHEPGLFAIGPLIGDNFVRFCLGGALGITSYLSSKDNT